jgi:hypothetical protein
MKIKSRMIEGRKTRFEERLEKAEAQGWLPKIGSKNTVAIPQPDGRFFLVHTMLLQRWEVD